MSELKTHSYPRLPNTVYRRTAFLGDSITDGNTYPSLVQDAVRQTGRLGMVAINAGIGGDTAEQMAARLDRDVLVHQPTLVTFSAGGNDLHHGVTAEQYEQAVRSIIERVRERHIPLILLTTIYRPPTAKPGVIEGLANYDKVLRRLASEYTLHLAEVGARMNEDAEAGHEQLVPNDGHPGYQGQRMIARAVLDAMGYDDIPVPERLTCTLRPGVIASWQLRSVAAEEAPLTEPSVAALDPDDSWITLTLPQAEPLSGDGKLWLDDYRRQGMATELKKWIGGETDKFIGTATIVSRTARTSNFHTGANLSKIWLNGQQIYENLWHHGWHAGRESVAVELRQGPNTVVIETGEQFFLSVSSGSFWK